MEKFIYVFDTESRDKLLSAGFDLVHTDRSNGFYIFENKRCLKFDANNLQIDRSVLSNTLRY